MPTKVYHLKFDELCGFIELAVSERVVTDFKVVPKSVFTPQPDWTVTLTWSGPRAR